MDSLVSILPSTICRIELMFLVFKDFNEIFYVDSDQHNYLEHWNAIDNVLASNRFPKLTYVELTVDTYNVTYILQDSIIELRTYGTLKRFLPKLYARGILWCGERHSGVAYPTTGDPADWVPHAILFPLLQNYRERKRYGVSTGIPRSPSE